MKKLFWILLSVLACGGAMAQNIAPQPYTATYEATFRGIEGGTLRMQLRRDEPDGHYVFETHAKPTVLASFFVSRDAFERTTLEATADGLRPVTWEADDGRSGVKNDGKLQFNWQEHTVTGVYEGKPVSLPLTPATGQLQTIQLTAMLKMQAGKEPGTLTVVNGDKIQEYSYNRTGTATLDTKMGKLETVIYESVRQGSNRVSRIWHAPSLGYIPVRAEQIRKGKLETVLALVELERGEK